MNDVKLKDLYMGLPDGEVEARDKRFQELFFDPNNKYNEIINSNEKFLIIGSKGTNKWLYFSIVQMVFTIWNCKFIIK